MDNSFGKDLAGISPSLTIELKITASFRAGG